MDSRVAAAPEQQARLEGEADFVIRRGTRPPALEDTEVVTVRGGCAVYVAVVFSPPACYAGMPPIPPLRYRRRVALLVANMAVSARVKLERPAPTVVLPVE